MERLLTELTQLSAPTAPVMLRSELPATAVIVDALTAAADAQPAPLRHIDMPDEAGDGVEAGAVRAVEDGMRKGEWVYVANVHPRHSTLLRRIAVMLFVADPAGVHPAFRLWLSTLTRHTVFEPPPGALANALPLVLLHLCNAPCSLLGDMDAMRVVPRHVPDRKRYDGDAFATAMADTAERLAQSDPALTRLSFAEQRATGVGDGDVFFSMLPDAIRLNHVLVELDLEGCQVGDEGASQMGFVLRANRSLRRLRLCRNLIQNDGVLALCDGLERNPALRLLDLSHNPGMGDASLRRLAAAVSGDTQSLEELQLNGNNAFSRPELRWSRRALRELWGGIARSRLTRVEMRSCGLSGAAVAALAADALAANPPLRVLDLSENRIGDHGAVPLARVLKHQKNTTLREMWLDDCCLGLASFVGFGAALKSCTCLGVLSLCHALPVQAAQRMNVSVDAEEEEEPTPVPPEEVDEKWVTPDGTAQMEGIQALSDGLQHNSVLHTLRMGHCQITDDALHTLCHALSAAERSGLTSLDLSANYTLSDRGAQVLKAFLQGRDAGDGGCRLRAVQLTHNDIEVGERAVLALDRSVVEEMVLDGVGVTCGVAMSLRDSLAAATGSRLRRLDLSANRIHREGFQRIGEILQTHPLLEDVSLRDNLGTAHEGAAGLALDPTGRPAGLPRFKDWGAGVVRPFCRLLGQLRCGKSPFRRLDLRDNTLTDQCLEVIMEALRATDLPLEVDLRGNLGTAASLPLVDAAMEREGLSVAIEHTARQAATEAP